jgi:hypothetical protein
MGILAANAPSALPQPSPSLQQKCNLCDLWGCFKSWLLNSPPLTVIIILKKEEKEETV